MSSVIRGWSSASLVKSDEWWLVISVTEGVESNDEFDVIVEIQQTTGYWVGGVRVGRGTIEWWKMFPIKLSYEYLVCY